MAIRPFGMEFAMGRTAFVPPPNREVAGQLVRLLDAIDPEGPGGEVAITVR